MRTRLDSWKSIAQYLGRSPRTAQRWVSTYGLPVRHLGGGSGPIFAYTDELDVWLQSRGQTASEDTLRGEGPVLLQKPFQVSESVAQLETFDSSSSAGPSKDRSSELAARAYKMWEILSDTDLSVMTRLFREAIDLDPENAKAFAGLSFALTAGFLLGNLSHPISSASAEDALYRALDIDPESVDVKSSRAWLNLTYQRDWIEAREEFDEVLSSHPDFGIAVVGRALLSIANGNLTEAAEHLHKASIRNPLSAPTMVLRCWVEYLAGRAAGALDLIAEARGIGHSGSLLDAIDAFAIIDSKGPAESITPLESLVANSPHQAAHLPLMKAALGFSYAAAGQTANAHNLLREVEHSRVRDSANRSYPCALIHLGLNDHAKAMHCLRESYSQGSLWSLGFRFDPILAPLHDHPEFRILLRSLSRTPPGRLASAG